MSNECIGIMGKIFGHKFESVLTDYIPCSDRLSFQHSGDAHSILTAMATKKYKIVCSRCGCEAPR